MNPNGRARFLCIALVGLAATGCATDPSDQGAPVSLDAAARRGYDIAAAAGCMACHVASDVGPPFAGLAGRTVTLVDGSTVVADRAYLAESITDPGAKLTAGYEVVMPANSLTVEEVAAVVDYLEALRG